MKQIGAFEAKNKLAELLDLAEKRRGNHHHPPRETSRPPRPHSETLRPRSRPQAVEDIKKMRKGMHIDDATIKELINEGRR